MKTIISVLLLLLCAPVSANTLSCLEVDIVVVADLSYSIGENNAYVADAVSAFVDGFDLGEHSVKIGVVTFSGDAQVLVPLTTSKARLDSAVHVIRTGQCQGTTNLSKALYVAANEIMYGRVVTKMIVVVTDGAPDSNADAEAAANKIKAFGNIGICGVYVDASAGDPEFLESLCTSGCYSRTSFNALAQELKKLDMCM